GLPHAHIVFKIDGNGPVQADKHGLCNPRGYSLGRRNRRKTQEIVLQQMIHGPCSTDFLCWDAGKDYSTKFYPNTSCQTTHVDDRGFFHYRWDYIITGQLRNRSVQDGYIVLLNLTRRCWFQSYSRLSVSKQIDVGQ
ncbi:hypothetical protein J6590_095778, partial [Homalodisca vitripennis]